MEAGGKPQPAAVSIAVADTIVEAAAELGVAIDGDPGDPAAQLMLQATMAGMLSELAQPDGPAKIDTAQHAVRFVTLPSTDDSETSGAGDPGAARLRRVGRRRQHRAVHRPRDARRAGGGPGRRGAGE